MTPKIKQELNLLADMMLMIDGYRSCLESDSKLFDFSKSELPRDQKSWNKALTAYAFLNKKPEMLKFQVQVTSKNIDLCK